MFSEQFNVIRNHWDVFSQNHDTAHCKYNIKTNNSLRVFAIVLLQNKTVMRNYYSLSGFFFKFEKKKKAILFCSSSPYS